MQARCCWCGSPFVEAAHTGLTFWRCPTPACFARQCAWAMGVKQGRQVSTLYLPLPRQVEALDAVRSQHFKWILFGGARGGGKSRFLRWLAYFYCSQIPGFQALLIRRTYPDLEKSHMRWVGAEVERLGGQWVPSGKPPVVRWPNRSVLEFGHCQDAQDVEHYLSAEYNLVLPDELGTFEEDMILKIASSARIPAKEFRPCIVAATNPGARWVKDRWIDKVVDRDRYGSYDPTQYHFIPSRLDDNPYPDPEYEAFLNSLDPATKAAWRYGSWDVFEGQYFGEFSRVRHCAVLDIPSDVPRIGGLDWGYAQPGVLLWAVVLPDGRLHVEREFKFRLTVAEVVAREVAQINRRQGITLATVYADPSMWIRQGQTGESVAETFLRAGIPLHRANHERVNGWQRLRHWFRDSEAGTPWITINPECFYLIRTLPSLIYDETKPEDLDTSGDDHAADALRYLVMGRPTPWSHPAAPPPGPDTAGFLLREAQLAASPQGILGRSNVRAR